MKFTFVSAAAVVFAAQQVIASGPVAGCLQTHTVVAGESCDGIAATFKITSDQFYAMNPGLHHAGDHLCDNLDDGKKYCVCVKKPCTAEPPAAGGNSTASAGGNSTASASGSVPAKSGSSATSSGSSLVSISPIAATSSAASSAASAATSSSSSSASAAAQTNTAVYNAPTRTALALSIVAIAAVVLL